MSSTEGPPNFTPEDSFIVSVFNGGARELWQSVIDKIAVLNETLNPGGDRTASWPLVDECLTLMVRVTRIFWPVKTDGPEGRIRKLRGELMRSVVGAPQAPPRELRRVRNAVEHLDERIDDWLAAPGPHNIVGLTVAPVGWVKGATLARHFDDTTGVVYIFGEQVNLQAAISEVEALIKGLPCLGCGEFHDGGHPVDRG